MRKTFLLLFVILWPTVLIGQTRALVFTHVTVIDMVNAKPKTNMTVVVKGNRITSIEKSNAFRVPKNSVVVNARAKFLIPGLWDMHVHALRKERVDYFLPLFVANGITGIRDMGTTAEGFAALGQLREEITSGARLGPRIIAAGRILDGAKPAVPENSIPFTNTTEARAAVRFLKQAGADFIKVYDGVPRDSYFAIVEEARKLNIPFAGHIPAAITEFEASDAGQKSIEHLGTILRDCSTLEPKIIDERTNATIDASAKPNDPSLIPIRITARTKIELETYSEQKCTELFARFVRNETWQVPTLIIKQTIAFSDSEVFRNDPHMKYISADTLDGWKPENNRFLKYQTAEFLRTRKQLYQKEVELVGVMHRAGVRFMAGTDIPGLYTYPGFSLHDELSLLVQAGFTPFEALQTATRNPAEFLKLSNRLGTIERGKLADLVLLEANPLEDVANTKRIVAVVVNGRYLSKETRQKMLDDVESLVNKR